MNLAILAPLLERLDRSTQPVDAAQYRSVASRLAQELAHSGETAGADDAVHALLRTHPAAATLYENAHYAQAGLCRSPLDASLAAEIAARDAIATAMRRTPDEAGSR